MRKKEYHLIIAFHSTHDAMAFEETCLANGAEGRLIPLPKEISAGCGLAWCAKPGAEESLSDLLALAGIIPQEKRICLI